MTDATTPAPGMRVPPRNLKFRVTQPDIDESVCGSRSNCMIARAFRRCYLDNGSHGYLTVDELGISVTVGQTRKVYTLSKPCRQKAKEFDVDKSLAKPFTVNARFAYERPVAPPASPGRKDQINENRREVAAKRRRGGPPPRPYDRFASPARPPEPAPALLDPAIGAIGGANRGNASSIGAEGGSLSLADIAAVIRQALEGQARPGEPRSAKEVKALVRLADGIEDVRELVRRTSLDVKRATGLVENPKAPRISRRQPLGER